MGTIVEASRIIIGIAGNTFSFSQKTEDQERCSKHENGCRGAKTQSCPVGGASLGQTVNTTSGQPASATYSIILVSL